MIGRFDVHRGAFDFYEGQEDEGERVGTAEGARSCGYPLVSTTFLLVLLLQVRAAATRDFLGSSSCR
jgi:hypothetical protein